MKEIRKLMAVLVSLSMLVANLTAAVVSADEITETEESAGSEITEIAQEVTQTEGSAEAVSEAETAVEEAAEEPEQQVSDEPVQEEGYSGEQSEEENAPEQEIQYEEFTGSTEASSVNTGKGEIEGLVNTKVFQVTLPVSDSTLDYVADPQGLIYQTNAAKHPDTVYDENSNVFFRNDNFTTDDGRTVTRYSDVSNPLKVVNKSSCAVNVVARVSAYYEQGADNLVKLAADKNWDNIKDPSIFLSVIRSDDGSQTVLSQKEQIITAAVPGCPDAYKSVYENEIYKYRLMSDEELAAFRSDSNNADKDTEFKEFALSMTAQCNSSGEWNSELKYDFPSTAIIWNVGFAASAKPCISTTEYTVAYSSAIDIPYSLGAFDSAATGIASMKYTAADGSELVISNGDGYVNTTDDTIALTSEFAYYAHGTEGGVLRVVFNDPEETAFSITLDNNAAPGVWDTEYTVSATDSKLTINYDLGVGNKAASGIKSITFGTTDFNTTAYSSVSDGSIRLNTSAIRKIAMKNGGKLSIVFDDEAHTKCSVTVRIS